MPNYMNLWIKKSRRRLIEEHGGKCSESDCDSKEDLEFAHVSETKLYGRGRGRKERYYDVVKNPNSYRLLCKKHHNNFDKQIL